ncbi:MAG: AMP-binding protein [Gammaproteobacteria bacterium]|nr:AMP-binding protein [Gammaproteobacteria bacterium]NIM74574.1 AMP-binding protein [Gammaproteobacteria bacterium]NIO26407.1 AMP-binding protein [Gammaproteobacteria bacterium]NIO66959.1 AMP-binding protein [Gammaproteobacteria bacterium]NIP44968.1 long-chain fatty acid--CoA ligase [Gammaproteobacteria bacterium]
MVETTPGGGAHSAALDTFPKLLLDRAERYRDAHAAREKEFGIWQSWTWHELAEGIQDLACGLAELGFQRGDKIAIIGDNRPRLYASMCAAQALGGVPVPMYQDGVAKELQFVVNHAEVRFAIGEDQEQVDKLLEIKDACPRLETIIYDDPRGLRKYEQSYLFSYKQVQEMGRGRREKDPGFFTAEVAKGSGSDTAIILYTSGTTGNPKGVMLSHDNIIITARNSVERDGLRQEDEVLAYLPMAWVGDNLFSFGQAYVAGFCVNCPESGATVMQDLREVGPTYFFAPPAIYESLLTNVMIRMEDAAGIKQKMFGYFMAVAKRVGTQILDGEAVSTKDRLLYWLGGILVYGPLKNTLGLSRVRIAYTAGEAIGPDIFDFYRSLGINIKQLYGQTEAAVFVTMQPDGEIKPDTVGTPAPQVEIRIADNGEVMYRSPGVFQCYYKNPEATAETKTEDGWVHTGDAGYIDEDGHLKIIDRAKDVGKLNDGSMFAPKYIENKIKFFPQIKEAVAFGNERDYVTLFINIDLDAVGNWAEKRNIPYASYQELAARPEVIELIQENLRKVNIDLAADAHLSGSQIRRFLILPKELDADDGELTRTLKVRRRIIAERYAPLIEALYSDQRRVAMQTQVTFEDGRTGTIKADVELRNVPGVAPVAKAS